MGRSELRQLPLRPAVRELMDEATSAGVRQAITITTTTSRSHVDALLGMHLGVVVTRSIHFENAAVEDAIAIGPGLHTGQGW